jgi:hypothetical protein
MLRYISLTLFLFLSLSITAQNKIKRTDYFYEDGDMFRAIEGYSAIINDDALELEDSTEIRIIYRYANALRLTYHYEDALNNFEIVNRSEYKDSYPLCDLNIGYCLKHLTKYDSASLYFKKYISNNPDKADEYKMSAEQEVLSCDLAINLLKTQADNVIINRLSDKVNTKFADFAPHLIGDYLFYSTMRFESMSERRRDVGDPNKKHLYSKIMTSEVKGLAKGVQLNQLNKPYRNVGNSAVSQDGKRLYFARGRKSRKSEWNIIAKLYVSEYNEQRKKWNRPRKLPFNTKDLKTSTQPHVSYDSTELCEVIFFSSTRKGGYGGFDLWKVYHYGGGKYSEPINLGDQINTVGDEMTAHFYQPTQTLYFSSNWHPNLGGYDIFSSKTEKGIWSKPKNMGIPLNGAANDLYFYTAPNDKNLGYLTSNRIGSNILLGKSCCNDIYQVAIPDSIIYKSYTDSLQQNDSLNANNIVNNEPASTDNKGNELMFEIVPKEFNSDKNPYTLPTQMPIDKESGKPYTENSPYAQAFREVEKIATLSNERKLYWDNDMLVPLKNKESDINPLYAFIPESSNSPEVAVSLPRTIPKDPQGMPYQQNSPEYLAFQKADKLAEKSKDRKLYWKDGILTTLENINVVVDEKPYLYKVQIAAVRNLKPYKYKMYGEGKFSPYKVIFEKNTSGVNRVVIVPKIANADGSYAFTTKEEALSLLKSIVETNSYLDAFVGFYLDNKRIDGLLLRN